MITKDLKERLEKAYYDTNNDIDRAIVIAKLQSDDLEDTVYLVAKEPSEEMYYGIRENEFMTKKILAGHPLDNLTDCGLKEVFVEPFSAMKYIKTGKKEM